MTPTPAEELGGRPMKRISSMPAARRWGPGVRHHQLLLCTTLLLLLAHAALPGARAAVTVWPTSWLERKAPRPDISAAAACRAASGGHVYPGDSIYPPLQSFFKVNGPVLSIPKNKTDIATAATIIQLAVPALRLVLDPLLFLAASSPAAAGSSSSGGSSGGGSGGIPRLIHMTTRDKHELAPHQILSIISWGWHNKGYALLLYDDADISAYMQKFYPGFMPTYTQLKTAVERSDAWRYHVLCGHGGVYADTDTIAAAPVATWTDFATNPEPGLIVGVENRFHSQADAEEASYVHKNQMVQWVLAAKRSHPLACRLGPAIRAFVDAEAASGGEVEAAHGHDAAILLRTGPGIWSAEVHAFLAAAGGDGDALAEAGGRVGDVVVLPTAAFGCNFHYWAPASSSSTRNNASFVYHMYMNSWKVDHYRVADAKKAQRRAREEAAAASVSHVRLLTPLLVGLSAAFVLALLGYCGLCWAAQRGSSGDSTGGGGGGGTAAAAAAALGLMGRRRRRAGPHAFGAGSSPRGSPLGSPRSSGSPRRGVAGAGGGSSSTATSRYGALLGGSTRKSARLHD